MRRNRPLSDDWGFDRGVPIDRYWIERFLQHHEQDVRGVVLEVKDRTYTRHFGGDRVERSWVLDIDPGNSEADLVADLGEPSSLPSGAFDCFIFTQTLQLIRNPMVALENAWRTLRDGGVLLVSVPVVSRLSEPTSDYWRFTPAGLEVLLRDASMGDVEVTAFGNVFTGMSFLAGQASHELTAEELDAFDQLFAVLACGRVEKTRP